MTQTEISNYLTSGALYRKPSGEIIAYFGPFSENSYENLNFSVALQDFYSDQIHFFTAKCQRQMGDSVSLVKELKEFARNSSIPGSPFMAADFGKFALAFQEIQQRISKGQIQKAVPIVFKERGHPPTLAERANWILNLLKMPMHLHVYGFWSEDRGIMGATPEILFHKKNNILKSMALAGTAKKTELLSFEEFLNNPKELHEHQLVVEDIQDQLKKLGPVVIDKTRVLELPSLVHLKTDIEVHCAENSLSSIVRLLHPTPALGVYPRGQSMDWLQKLPYQQQRGLFGAPLVFKISEDESVCLVAIRCVQWEINKTQIGAGCGIVKQSDVQKEWQELNNKLDSVLSSLGMQT